MRLDPSQAHAVNHPAATLRILAGPGSGKTRVLTARIARRAQDEIDPRRILALTFTRRAANELRQRLTREGIRDIGAVGTFHGVALQQLRLHQTDQGRRPPKVVANRIATIRSLAESPSESRLAAAADAAITGSGAGRRSRDPRVGRLIERYNAHKRRRGLLDFDDILSECTRLLNEHRRFADAQRWRFRHLFVDEFQDVNTRQFELLQAWLGGRDDLCVVGDPNQAIYEWNGADARYLDRFTDWFPGAHTVSLHENHRSTAVITRTAAIVLGDGALGADNTDDDTALVDLVGELPQVDRYDDTTIEATGVAARLRWLHGRRSSPSGRDSRWSDFAVLARTNAQLDDIARALLATSIPHRVRGRGGLSQHPAATELLDALRSSGNRFTTVLVDNELEPLTDDQADVEAAAAVSSVLELAREFADAEPRASGAGFAAWLSTVRAGDVVPDHDAVDLVTFHAAKGLEWPHVFIVGAEEGLVPMNDSSEERRLAYVAVTRAERSINLSWCATREVSGQVERRRPSRWLTQIDAESADSVPSAPEQRSTFITRAREHIGGTSLSDSQRSTLARLEHWRSTAASSRRVLPEEVMRDATLHALALERPASLEAMANTTGLSTLRLRRDAAALLEALGSTSAGPHADG